MLLTNGSIRPFFANPFPLGVIRTIGGLSMLVPLALTAQSDTLQPLPVVTIRDSRFEQTGFAAWTADTLPVGAVLSLADRLFWENPVAVRANAPGTLATLSARGLGPAHTPVFWQGLNLQSPQNGTVDAALLPLWPGDQVEVRYGGQSAALSSGAMGGAVLLESRLRPDSIGFFGQLGGGLGSFGRQEASATMGWAAASWASETRAAGQRADNDFPFRNFARLGAPRVLQTGNQQEKWDLQQLNRWTIDPKNSLRTAVWGQRAFREIPPAMTEAPTTTWQRDQALRAVAHWETTPGPRRRWQHRLAWMDEAIAFRLADDVDSSRARTALLGTEYSAAAGRRWRWKAGATGIWQTAQADGYADSSRWFRQVRGAVFGMVERDVRRGRWSVLLRQEWLDGEAAPFTWSLGGNFGPLRFHVSRNFNWPTFNDRYWRAWGNPDLKPEAGYSGDVGMVLRNKTALSGVIGAEATLFSALVDNWILWQPGPDGIFRPGNLRQVWSRGGEAALRWERRWRNLELTMRAGGQLVRATNVAVYAGEPGVLHQQLPYVPQYGGNFSLRLARAGFSAAYLHQWTGQRFTTTDNTVALPGFHTGNLLLQYRWALRGQRALLFDARLDNCWNSAYQIIAYRPMPGRNWRAGVQWVF